MVCQKEKRGVTAEKTKIKLFFEQTGVRRNRPTRIKILELNHLCFLTIPKAKIFTQLKHHNTAYPQTIILIK